VQGPFTQDRIQGLLKRGRFSRHFHVSEDKKNWYPAGDFPELFAGVGRASSSDDDDDTPFSGGGSPFDDDDMAPTRVGGGGKKKSRKRRVEEDDDDEYEDNDDAAEDEWEDDEDWDNDNVGLVGRLSGYIEANLKAVVALLVLALLAAGWFVFGRESFAQDAADYEVLIAVKSKVSSAHKMGGNADEWVKMADATEAQLSSMVDRLNEDASSRDHLKQELLFVARDDIPRMIKELPKGDTTSEERVTQRFQRIERMLTGKVRQDQESILSIPRPAPSQPAVPNGPQNGQKSNPNGQNSSPQSPPGNGGQTPNGNGASVPPNGTTSGTPNGSPAGQSPPMNANPQGTGSNPASPGVNQPNTTQPRQPAPNSGSSNPGRPAPAKF